MRSTLLKLSRAVFNWPPRPATAEQKYSIVRRFGRERKLDTLIETGTFRGDMVEAQRKNFKKIISIELGDELYEAARNRFKGDDHILVLHGDSSSKLGEAIGQVQGPVLYWLDAHYSRGITAHGSKETPVLSELSIISARAQKGDTVLIDDARHFGLKLQYPRLSTVKKFVEQHWPGYSCDVVTDVICIVPP